MICEFTGKNSAYCDCGECHRRCVHCGSDTNDAHGGPWLIDDVVHCIACAEKEDSEWVTSTTGGEEF
jgi:organic radical activating enzyme